MKVTWDPLVTYDIDHLPKVSEVERDRVAAMTDDEIDFSDIPEITDFSGFVPWKDRHVARNAKRRKVEISVEADVGDWLAQIGDVNKVLRTVMSLTAVAGHGQQVHGK